MLRGCSKKKIQFSSKSENQVQKVQEQILNQKNSNLNLKKNEEEIIKKTKESRIEFWCLCSTKLLEHTLCVYLTCV